MAFEMVGAQITSFANAELAAVGKLKVMAFASVPSTSKNEAPYSLNKPEFAAIGLPVGNVIFTVTPDATVNLIGRAPNIPG